MLMTRHVAKPFIKLARRPYPLIAIAIICMWVVAGCKPRGNLSNPVYNQHLGIPETASPAECLQMLDSIRATAFKEQVPGVNDMAIYYRKRAECLRSINIQSSLNVLDTLETYLKQHKYLPEYNRYYIQMLTGKVEAYTHLKQYDEGIKTLLEAKQFIDKHFGNSCMNCEFQLPLSDMLMKQGRYVLAASYFRELYNNAQLCDSLSFDRYYYSYSGLTNAGYGYYEAQLYDSAQYYLKASLRLIDEYAPLHPEKRSYLKLSRGVVSRHLGYAQLALKKYDDAERLIISAIDSTAKEYPTFALVGKTELARLYLESNQLEKAREVLDYLENNSEKFTSDYPFYAAIYQYRKEYFQKQGDFKTALYYSDLAKKMNDSLDIINRKNIERDFAMEFAAKEQKTINEHLRLKNENTSFQLQIAILVALIAVLLILFTWVNLRRTSKHAQQLRELNDEIHRQKQDIVDAYTALEKSYIEKQSFLHTVAHDLKNPLSGIASLAHALNKSTENVQTKESLSLIREACSNSLNLINDIISSDSSELNGEDKEMNDMWRLLEYSVELMKPKAEEKQQQLVLRGQSAEVVLNKDKIWRVITNIINNAIKFSPPKSKIQIALEKLDDAVIFSVKDQGIGIPDNLMDKLFSNSYEARRTGTAGEVSYGLGLGISKRIVEEHGGKLWVESKEGIGSTFFVQLPAA